MTLLIWLAVSSLLWGGVLWIAGRALQRSSNVSGAARQWIWRGATALLLAPWIATPFVVMFGLGLAPAEQIATMTVATTPVAAHDVTASLVALDATDVQTQVVSNGGSVMSWLSARSLPEMVLLALMAGWLVRFVLAQLALRSLLGIVNVSREAESGVAKSFVQSWAQRLKLRPAPRLRIVAEQHSPFSYGILRPTICVPEGMEDKLSRGSLDLVVGHESLHIARGDGWLRPVERVTADVLWFNPFAWLIRRELDVARELAVDEAVLAMSNARVAYARTLRDVAGFAAGLPAAVPAASMSLPGGRNLMMRVSRTLSHAGKKPAPAAILAACLLGMAAAPIAIAQVMMAVPAPPAPPPVPAIDAVAPVAPVAPVEPVADVEPAPPPPALEPAPPTPPIPPATPPAGAFDSKTGNVSATFKSRVISTRGDATNGYRIELLQTARNEEGEICLADLSGLGELTVKQGDIVNEGQTVGKSRKGNRMRFTVACSDDLDETGRPKASPPPVPPVPPVGPVGPVGSIGPIAPLAVPAPLAAPKPLATPIAAPNLAPHVSVVAPMAPVAPLAPMVAPAPPSPVSPKAPVAPAAPRPIPSSLEGAPYPVIAAPARVSGSYGQRVDPFTQKLAFHEGVDIAAAAGSAIYTPVGGVVTFVGVKNGRGNVVEVDGKDGYRVSFSQMQDTKVKTGESVASGQVVGTVGSSGQSTGPHLHFEISRGGETQDPEKVQGLALIAGR